MPKKRAFYRMPRPPVTQPLDPSYKIIALTQGQFSKVDTADHPWLDGFNWHADWNKDTQSFYAKRRENGKPVYMSREILGCGPDELAEHENHDTLDNRRKNLRKATYSQNTANQKHRPDNASGHRGVYWADGKWRAQIRHNGKLLNLGRFVSLQQAAMAYNEKAKELYGEFATLNTEE